MITYDSICKFDKNVFRYETKIISRSTFSHGLVVTTLLWQEMGRKILILSNERWSNIGLSLEVSNTLVSSHLLWNSTYTESVCLPLPTNNSCEALVNFSCFSFLKSPDLFVSLKVFFEVARSRILFCYEFVIFIPAAFMPEKMFSASVRRNPAVKWWIDTCVPFAVFKIYLSEDVIVCLTFTDKLRDLRRKRTDIHCSHQ